AGVQGGSAPPTPRSLANLRATPEGEPQRDDASSKEASSPGVKPTYGRSGRTPPKPLSSRWLQRGYQKGSLSAKSRSPVSRRLQKTAVGKNMRTFLHYDILELFTCKCRILLYKYPP